MKQLITLSTLFLLLVLPDAVQAQPFAGGSGTEVDPYQIETATQLDSVRNYLNKHFILNNDIDLSFYTGNSGGNSWNGGEGWEPIGDGTPFSGSLDGNGFVISGLTIDRPTRNGVGLFDTIDGGEVSFLGLEAIEITGDGSVGGIAGTNGNSVITDSYVVGSVTGSGTVGGLAGAHVFISGSGGGLVKDCFTAGTVTGDQTVGGLIGNNINGEITNNYAAAVVSGNTDVGGLVGLNSGFVNDSFWNTEISGQNSSAGGVGYTIAEMKHLSNFNNFDFSWENAEEFSFPYLPDVGSYRIGGPEITGSAGWRMYGSPFINSTYNTILDSLWTQGFTNADVSNGTANVQIWDETNQQWVAPTSQTSSLAAGTGFIVYVYEDDDPLSSGIQGGFPKSIVHKGEVNPLPVSPALGNTNGADPSLDGFNLVANPSASTIDWDQVSRTNVSDTYYVWDPANGHYDTYQTGVGGTNGGTNLIAPSQGFWVQATAASPDLTIDSAAVTTGGSLYKKENYPTALLHLESSDGSSDEVRVVIRPDAEKGLDEFDAPHLKPLSSSWLSLSSITDDRLLSIDSRPVPKTGGEVIVFPLSILHRNDTGNGQYTLSLAENELPAGWSMELRENSTGRVIGLDQETSYSFDLSPNDRKARSSPVEMDNESLPGLTLQAEGGTARFTLTVNPGGMEQSLTNDPEQVELTQNYPNPFNPETVIRYGVPEGFQGRVQLDVFDLLGRRVATLVDARIAPGRYEVSFDAGRLSSGMYVYRLQVGSDVFTRKMTLIK